MSRFGYFPRFTSCSVAEEMFDWLAKQKNIVLAKADNEWCLTIKGNQFRGEDLVTLLIDAESVIDDNSKETADDIRKKREAIGAVSGDHPE